MARVRITADWPADPAHAGRPVATPFADPLWRAGFAALGAAGGVADIMLWPEQLDAVATLAEAFPATQIVIEHFAVSEPNPVWRSGFERLAMLPNVAVKLSGPGLVRRDWSAETIAPMIRELVDLFGCDRLMIGGNAPVDLIMADYATIVARFDAAIAWLPERDRRKLWHDTAARLYRIEGHA